MVRSPGSDLPSRIKLRWRHADARGLRPGVQSTMPDGNDEFGVANGQRAGQVHGVGTPQSVLAGELASMAFNRGGQLYRPTRCPVLLPCLLGAVQLILTQVMVASGCGQRVRARGRPDARGRRAVAGIVICT
jgi:hypothetical protein